MKEAVKLSGTKPSKLTRNDLLVYGGWLKLAWTWSRDVNMSLDEAMENSKRLGQDFRLVGNPRKTAKKKRAPRPPAETPPPSVPIAVPAAPVITGFKAEERAPLPRKVKKRSRGFSFTKAKSPKKAKEPSSTKNSPKDAEVQMRVFVRRLQYASVFCAVALPIGYLFLGGTVFMLMLMTGSVSIIVGTAVLTLRERGRGDSKKHLKERAPGSDSASIRGQEGGMAIRNEAFAASSAI